MQAAAAKHGVWLIPGSLFEKGADGKLCNMAYGRGFGMVYAAVYRPDRGQARYL